MASIVYNIEDSDRVRWIAENRYDIINILTNESAVWMGDHLISSKTGRKIYSCPFLKLEDSFATCTIYETRPNVCRNFMPGSSQICPLSKK